jgi:hypothetical protein
MVGWILCNEWVGARDKILFSLKRGTSIKKAADHVQIALFCGMLYDGEKVVCNRWLAAALRPDLKDPNLQSC